MLQWLVQTQVRDLIPSQKFYRVNELNISWTCQLNNVEKGIVLVDNGFEMVALTYSPTMVTSEDDMVMALLVGDDIVEPAYTYLTNENSNITHFAVDNRPICGHRFTQNSTNEEMGQVTCESCLKLLPTANILG